MKYLDALQGMTKKALFDSGCFEFNRTTLRRKLEVLEALNSGGHIDTVIKEYLTYYKGKEYMINSLKSTLRYYISNLKYGENHEVWELKDKEIPELVRILKNELELKVK